MAQQLSALAEFLAFVPRPSPVQLTTGARKACALFWLPGALQEQCTYIHAGKQAFTHIKSRIERAELSWERVTSWRSVEGKCGQVGWRPFQEEEVRDKSPDV